MRSPFAILALVILASCTSVHQRDDGTWDVPRTVEVRSPFGTNVGFVKLEHCLTKLDASSWNPFASATYTNCHRMERWVATHSQGQGGQIVSGSLTGLGFGLGSAFSGAGNSTTSSVTVPATTYGGKGHH